MKKITILGSTGSVGKQTLDFISQHPDTFQVHALTVGTKADALIEQALQFRPKKICIKDTTHLSRIKEAVSPMGIEAYGGDESICDVASDTVDMVMSAIVGSDGLAPTMSAVQAKNTIALANKESLVCAGHMVMQSARENDVEILPVDSEHSALFQVYNVKQRGAIKDFTLTASGGALRDMDYDSIQNATPEQVLQHPNWDMGNKITVDSAGFMNKGFEVIEACHLFDIPEHKVKVVVHPQSIVHSYISYCDGTTLANMGYADMRTPIAVALAYPHRLSAGVDVLDLASVSQLDFYAYDKVRFPALQTCRDAFNVGGGACAVLNGANEVAVQAFLTHKLPFGRIIDVVHYALDGLDFKTPTSIEEFEHIHMMATKTAEGYIKGM